MLVVLAATGVLRGLQDTRTPLVVATAGFASNAVLSFLLVHGPGPLPALGVAGSAWGTVAAQLGMAGWLVALVVRGARREGTSLRPHGAGVRAAAVAGVPLLLRTVTLRLALLATVWAAASTGTESLAAHQVVFTVWTFAAFVLDALAIAAQALTGRSLGAGDAERRPGHHPADGPLGRGRRRAARRAPGGRRRRGCRGCSARTPRSGPASPSACSSSGSRRRSRATCSCSTACSSAPATARTWPGRASSRCWATCPCWPWCRWPGSRAPRPARAVAGLRGRLHDRPRAHARAARAVGALGGAGRGLTRDPRTHRGRPRCPGPPAAESRARQSRRARGHSATTSTSIDAVTSLCRRTLTV